MLTSDPSTPGMAEAMELANTVAISPFKLELRFCKNSCTFVPVPKVKSKLPEIFFSTTGVVVDVVGVVVGVVVVVVVGVVVGVVVAVVVVVIFFGTSGFITSTSGPELGPELGSDAASLRPRTALATLALAMAPSKTDPALTSMCDGTMLSPSQSWMHGTAELPLGKDNPCDDIGPCEACDSRCGPEDGPCEGSAEACCKSCSMKKKSTAALARPLAAVILNADAIELCGMLWF
mmetsp:Transcript_59679/g.142005  ORF Transcript_59679/g.142005 Transcript_59679/m.142005 type:complete len:234 (-) Transcript_59679:109-810(-)